MNQNSCFDYYFLLCSTPPEDVHAADDPQAHTSSSCDLAGFTPDKVESFQTRFENDYDIYTDSNCSVAWFHTFHPEGAPPLATIYASVSLQSRSPSWILHYLIVVPK